MKSANKVKSLLVATLLLLFLNPAFSQENYLPGYILSLKGDTVHGFIDYRNWANNPAKIFFKKQLNDNSNIYTSVDINGFGVSNEIYERAIVEIDISTDMTENLDNNPELILITDTVFLQAIILGPRNLYCYLDKSVKNQFYVKLDTAFQLLYYKRYKEKQKINTNTPYMDNTFLMKQKTQTIIVSDNRYFSQLKAYLFDCPNIENYLEKVEYSIGKLENLFLQYYACTNSQVHFQKSKEAIRFQKRILAGVTYTTLKFEGDGFKYLTKADFAPSIDFSGGLSFDYIFPRNFKRFSLNNELLFSTYKCIGNYTDYTSENEYKKYASTIGLSYIRLNTMLSYSHPVGAAHIYANAGILYGIVVATTNLLTTEKKFYSSNDVSTGKAMQDMSKRELGYSLGLGSKYKRYSVELKSENGNGMSNYQDLKSTSNRLYFLFGFRF